MLLSHLAVDHLERIFFFLGGSEFVALAPTCKPLHHVIMNRGIITTWKDAAHHGEWLPRLAYNRPQLKELLFNVSYPSLPNAPAFGIPDVLSFGPSLQVLEFRGSGALWPFLLFRRPNSPPALSHEKIYATDWINLEELVPNLLVLAITDFSQLEQSWELSKTFPRSLTSLTVTAFEHSPFIIEFPEIEDVPSLTHLKICPAAGATPPALVRLYNHPTLLSIHTPDQYVANAPNTPRLTSVSAIAPNPKVRMDACTHLTLHRMGLFLELMPPCLTYLSTVFQEFIPLAKALPPTMTKLELRPGSPHIDSWMLAYLPEGLIHFEGIFRSSFSSSSTLKTLETLREKENIHRWLPPRLQALLSYDSPAIVPHWRMLPSSLTQAQVRLDLKAPDALEASGPLNLRNLCPKLTGKLQLSADTSEPSETLSGGSDVMPHYFVDWTFPKGLSWLSFKISALEGLDAAIEAIFALPEERWPRYLETVEFRWTKLPSTLPSFKSLPSSIEELFIKEAPSADSLRTPKESNSEVKRATDLFISSFSTLPKHLKTLELHTNLVLHDCVAFLKHLPATLTSLDSRSLHNFDDEAAPLVPPNLETLHIRHSQLLSDRGVAMLPQTLEYLILDLNRKITPEVLRIIPPKLCVLDLPKNTNFKSKTAECQAILEERGMQLTSVSTKHLDI